MTAPLDVPDEPGAASGLPGPPATVSLIYDPFNPSEMAVLSVARRLQEYLLEMGAIPEGAPLPFPALHRSAG